LADPSNPLIQKERDEENVEPGELIRGLVDVRSRLDRIKKGKEGRAKLVGVVLDSGVTSKEISKTQEISAVVEAAEAIPNKSEMRTMVDIDRRMGELENLVGSSSTSLDEVKTSSFRSCINPCSCIF
jgi:nuclear migration protein JNM1